ncbi:MAG: transcriptional regulator [Thermodesulfobacteriota bacterium]
MSEKYLTLRQEIAKALADQPRGLREISKIFRLGEKEVLEHLQHIAKSAKIVMEPAFCQKCGFIFKKRERLSTPSRCPMCRSEFICPPRYQLSGRK